MKKNIRFISYHLILHFKIPNIHSNPFMQDNLKLLMLQWYIPCHNQVFWLMRKSPNYFQISPNECYAGNLLNGKWFHHLWKSNIYKIQLIHPFQFMMLKYKREILLPESGTGNPYGILANDLYLIVSIACFLMLLESFKWILIFSMRKIL